jgi:hypothetical protein
MSYSWLAYAARTSFIHYLILFIGMNELRFFHRERKEAKKAPG